MILSSLFRGSGFVIFWKNCSREGLRTPESVRMLSSRLASCSLSAWIQSGTGSLSGGWSSRAKVSRSHNACVGAGNGSMARVAPFCSDRVGAVMGVRHSRVPARSCKRSREGREKGVHFLTSLFFLRTLVPFCDTSLMRRSDITISCSNQEEHEQVTQDVFSRRKRFWMNGGMGVNLSTAELVAAVMAEGGIGTLSGSAPGFNSRREEILADPSFEGRKQRFREADIAEIERQIRFVRAASPHGVLAVNILEPMFDFREMVDAIGSSGGVDLLLPAAGLPRDLARKMNEYPHMRYAPLVSGVRAAEVMIKAALNPKTGGRLPDAFYVELPQFAGGHLRARDDKDAANTEPADPAKPDGPRKFDKEVILEQIRTMLRKYGLDIPLILAGGIAYGEDIDSAFATDYDAVSKGTRLLLAEESGLPDSLYYKYYLDTRYRIATAMTSPAGLPSRYIDAGDYIGNLATVSQPCVSCIMKKPENPCGYLKPGGREKSYCIAQWLTKTALPRGEEGGVLFTGSRLVDMRGDPLYAENGKPHRPTTKETMAFVFDG